MSEMQEPAARWGSNRGAYWVATPSHVTLKPGRIEFHPNKLRPDDIEAIARRVVELLKEQQT